MYFSWRCLPKLWFSGVLIMHQWGRAVIQYYKHFPPPGKEFTKYWPATKFWYNLGSSLGPNFSLRYSAIGVMHLTRFPTLWTKGRQWTWVFGGILTKLLVHRMFIIQLIQACEQLAELKDPAYKWGHTRLVASHQCCSPWLNFRAFHCF